MHKIRRNKHEIKKEEFRIEKGKSIQRLREKWGIQGSKRNL
jgi:hypothetical protein